MAHSVYFCNYSIGEHAYGDLGKICRPFGTRVLLIHGEKAYAASKSALLPEMEKAGLTIVQTALYGNDCTLGRIHALAQLAKECRAEMIFGVGGGKAIDTAKGCADRAGLPVFTFPTIASTCAATTALSVVYRDDGSFDRFLFYDRPARHCFIQTPIIAKAPDQYLRAGMGDTMGKYFECQFAARGDDLSHSSALGREISRLCWFPLLTHAKQALLDCRLDRSSDSLEEAILAIVVSTGLVSLLVLDQYNGAVAHSVYYALCLYPGFEENNLHGDVVGYGVLVQLAIDRDYEQLAAVRSLLQELGIAVTLKEMGVPLRREALAAVLDEVIAGPDMSHLPYKISTDMVFDAMSYVENL